MFCLAIRKDTLRIGITILKWMKFGQNLSIVEARIIEIFRFLMFMIRHISNEFIRISIIVLLIIMNANFGLSTSFYSMIYI